MHKSLLLVSAVIALSLMAGTLHADNITVANPGFENTVLSNGGTTTSINSWVEVGTNNGEINPTSTHVSGEAFAGQNVAYSTPANATITQTLSNLLLANTTYTLSVQVGDRKDALNYRGAILRLLAGGVTIASATNANGTAAGDPADPNDGYVPLALVFATVGSHANLGQALGIQLATPATGSGQTLWDNVALSFESIPEPSALSLVALGGLALLRRRRA